MKTKLAFTIALAGAVCAASAGGAEEPLMVEKYLPFGDVVDVYDANGNFQYEAPVENMPSPPVKVLKVNADGSYLMVKDGVWLRKDFVSVNRSATVSSDLNCLVEARKGEKTSSGTYGVRGAAEGCN